MKINTHKYVLALMGLLMIVACSSSGGGDDTPPTTGGEDDTPMIPAPTAATLVFPEDETECNTGVVDPNNTALSTVTFQWNAGQNTDNYEVSITNLNTLNVIRVLSNTPQADIKIDRGTPFSWFVTSRATGTTETAVSQTFRFYNEGAGIENYAPFPALAIAPARGANLPTSTTVDLSWSGSDIDDDITSYEVFFGTDAANLASEGPVNTTTLENVATTANTRYFWRVTTIDAQGNQSQSELFDFFVN
ncbi:Fibronectin type-III repeats protein [Croceitalea dokdonensis DOKDO 023]|uniref:Fibronectin type-III repeats protein n=1 Tax=Croceitalea dokdonensis DOKDO 023 TaxID=1300341 RepID=A0A0P7AVH6_9FLAO|nr:hypothetical protein [Croceitalea dokdonensis]KPM32602.1 Fibronectin type-III repeats protein [Croceitalea dokdonensis DOKDO 023]